jgi:hypothetical protein
MISEEAFGLGSWSAESVSDWWCHVGFLSFFLFSFFARVFLSRKAPTYLYLTSS